MENKNRLTLNGLTTANIIYIAVSLAMVGVSLYLTKHFYNTHFPTPGMSGDTLCNADGFWGCDKATLSSLGSIFNVPTSFFGVIIGLMGVFGNIFPSESSEKTAKFFTYANFIGCIGLLLFSLIVLKGLCPFCTIYYVLSAIAAFLFYKYSRANAFPEIKPTGIYALLTIVPVFFMYSYFNDKIKTQSNLSVQYTAQYFTLNDMGDPANESPYKIHAGTKNFADAPIRLSVFSDFECPFCQSVSDQMHELALEFKEKISIQYLFYPLDNACNPNIKGAFHKFACKAAYLAACDKDKFAEIHDFLFKRQNQLSFENISKWEKEFGLSGCSENKAVQEEIMKTINAGEQFALKSTPTLILNGRKIEGTIPTVHLKAIMREILEKQNK
jgi:protein-disulfide isomerase